MNKDKLILRTRFIERASHWLMVLCFFAVALSGLSWFFPSLNGLNAVFGTPQLARILHPFFGVVVFLLLAFLFVRFVKYNLPEREDGIWFRNVKRVLAGDHSQPLRIGKYNAGQKILFWGIMGLITLLMLSGVIIWRPWFADYFSIPLIRIALFTHALAGISLMPTSQLTAFEESLNGLKSCSSLDEPTLTTAAVCPHCQFRPSAEQLELIPAASRLNKLDDDLDQLLTNWQQTLLENLEDPFTQDSLGLLPPASKKLIDGFLASRKLPDPMTSEFANAVQEALSGLEKIAVKGDEIKQALLQGGSPATPDDLRKRFDTFMNERCKGKDATKLRFVIE